MHKGMGGEEEQMNTGGGVIGCERTTEWVKLLYIIRLDCG